VGLKKLITEKLGIKPKISMAGLGVLDILVDGKTVYSYKETHEMPTDEQVLSLLSPK
jgi:hypothetical protein